MDYNIPPGREAPWEGKDNSPDVEIPIQATMLNDAQNENVSGADEEGNINLSTPPIGGIVE
jgi:hypothetical protein